MKKAKLFHKVLALLLVVATLCTAMVPVAFAATAYPTFSNSKYAEIVAQNKILCYRDSSLQTRGTCQPTASYGSYVDRGDVCKIKGFTNNGNSCILEFPTSSGYKTSYVRTSDVFPSSTAVEAFVSKARVTAYQYANGSVSWGYFDVGDTVYRTGAVNGDYSQVVYPVASGARFKVAWVRTSELNVARPTASTGVNPKGFIDRIEAMPAPCTFRIVGWAFDSDTPNNSLDIHVYVGGPAGSAGAKCYGMSATAYRPDVRKAYPSLVGTDYSGFDKTFTIEGLQGSVPIYVYAINRAGGQNVLLGSKTIYIQGKNSVTTSNTAMSYALYKSTGKLTCGFDGYVSTSGRHEGIDFTNAIGSAVYSLTDGVITKITEGYRGSKGLSTIAVYSEGANKTVVYLHSDPEDSLKVGQKVSRGQLIAYEDWRGCSKANSAHTHVEVRNGKRYAAAVSVGDSVLDNPNPTAFWNSCGYQVK